MVNIILPKEESRPLSFYLAMEEYIARHIDVDEAFFIWQVESSVILGRNQLAENEVNISYCKQNGVKIFRRKSGGGCVYADKSNMMLAYITNSDNVNFTYHKYITMVTQALRRLGIPATANGRNDILIEGRKVSGNAFYHLPGRSIVHGTLLYDTDMRNMMKCITPESAKLESKGVDSVRQRITLLKEHTQLSLQEIREFLISFLCDKRVVLSDDDIKGIAELEREYASADFIFNKSPQHTVVKKKHFDGVGTLEVSMDVKNNIIKNIEIKGDYFPLGDVDGLCEMLRGKNLTTADLEKVIPDNLDELIMNLNKYLLITLIIE